MDKKKLRKIIKDYVALLAKEGIPVKAVFLFGSYAKGKGRKDSDIDICIVSDVFGKNRLREGQFLFKKARVVDSRIEPIPVSSRAYKSDQTSPLLAEIRKHSIKIV